jgi:uncharacterized protein
MKDNSNKWLRHLVMLSNVPDKDTTDEHIRLHVLYLKELEDREELEVCGPFSDRSGGLIILKNLSREEAERTAARDPFVSTGLRSAAIRTFDKSCWENNHLGRLPHD